MNTTFEISEINRIVKLIKKVNCTNYASVAETAKEMGVKKTALMQYIEDNPKLFTLVEVQKPKVGLAIKFVYLTPETNPDTEEWMNLKKAEWDHKLHVGGKYYYNQLEFWYFPEETSESKELHYRNTEEKFKKLEEMGILQKTTKGYGGFSDYYKIDVYPCDSEVLAKLEEAGWTTDFEEIKARLKD